MNEACVKAAARLYELRDTARALWRDPAEYERRTATMRALLIAWMVANPGRPELGGFNEIAKRFQADGRDALLIPLGAALVDLIEGTS